MKSSDEDMERMLIRHFLARPGVKFSLDSIFREVPRPNGWRGAYFEELTKDTEKAALSAIVERMAKDQLLWVFDDDESGQELFMAAPRMSEHPRFDYLYPRIPDQIDGLISKLAPASNRTISFTDNQDLCAKLVDGVKSIEEKLNSSNELDPEEKSDVAVSLEASVSLFQKSKTFLVGAFQYLVLERIKKAFEKTIEDAIRLSILGLLATLVTLIMAAT